MHLPKAALTILIVTLFMFVFAQGVFACECPAPSGKARAISDEFERAATVIKAIVVWGPDQTEWNEQQSIKMRVEKVYKGKVKVDEILTFGQSGGRDCLWYFRKEDVGQRYLFYLDKPTKARPHKVNDEIEKSNAEAKYYVSTCGRSAAIDQAASDIAFLDKVRGPNE